MGGDMKSILEKNIAEADSRMMIVQKMLEADKNQCLKY